MRYRGHEYQRVGYVTMPALPKKFVASGMIAVRELGNLRNFDAIKRVVQEGVLPSRVEYELDYFRDHFNVFRTRDFYGALRNAYDYLEQYAKAQGDMFKAVRWLSEVAENLLTDAVAPTLKELNELKQQLNSQFEEYFGGPVDLANPMPEVKADLEHLDSYYEWSTYTMPALKEVHQAEVWLRAARKFGQFLMAQYRNLQKRWNEQSADARPYDVADLEIMWHVTTAYRAIMQGGFKTRDELGSEAAGLGGSVKGISFTAAYDVAEGIRDALVDAVRVLNSDLQPATLRAYGAELGLPDKTIEAAFVSQFGRGEVPAVLTMDQAFEIYRYLLTMAESEGERYNPLFFGVEASAIARVDPQDIGIIEATIDTRQAHEYLRSMEEWRVPKAGIASYGPVGSQKLP